MRSSLNSESAPAAAADPTGPGDGSEAAPGRSLATAARGVLLRVIGVVGSDALAQRLRASGLWDEAAVEVVGAAPFGDPLLIQLHGFRLALRRSEAARVLVGEVDS